MVKSIQISTRGRGLYEITDEIVDLVSSKKSIRTGLCTVFLRHTSASLLIQENADPSVRVDLDAWFERLVPEGDPIFTHTCEGPDDMPAHIKAALTDVNLSIPVSQGEAMLGIWQGIFVVEHRTRPHERQVVLHFQGNAGHESEWEME